MGFRDTEAASEVVGTLLVTAITLGLGVLAFYLIDWPDSGQVAPAAIGFVESEEGPTVVAGPGGSWSDFRATGTCPALGVRSDDGWTAWDVPGPGPAQPIEAGDTLTGCLDGQTFHLVHLPSGTLVGSWGT